MTDAAPKTAKAAAPLGTEIIVLVADDDADMRLYIRGCLRSRGDIHIVEATDGDEAFALATPTIPGGANDMPSLLQISDAIWTAEAHEV